MRLRITSIVTCIFIFTLISFSFPANAAIRIIFPDEDVWVSSDTVDIIGVLEGEDNTFVKVRVKKGKLLGSDKSPIIKGAFSAAVKLKKGKNRIIINSGKSKAERKIFFAASKKEIPEGLKPYYIHPAVEK